MTFFQMICLLNMWAFHSYAARLPAISSQELFEDHKYHNCNGLNSFSPLLEGIPKLKINENHTFKINQMTHSSPREVVMVPIVDPGVQ